MNKQWPEEEDVYWLCNKALKQRSTIDYWVQEVNVSAFTRHHY